jgi:hypothetical protein
MQRRKSSRSSRISAVSSSIRRLANGSIQIVWRSAPIARSVEIASGPTIWYEGACRSHSKCVPHMVGLFIRIDGNIIALGDARCE